MIRFLPARMLFRLLPPVAGLLLLAACGRQPAEPPPPPPPVHDLVMPNLLGDDPADLRTAAFAGQVQLAVFLLPGLESCRAVMSDWNALQADYGPRGFTVLGIVADDRPATTLAAEAAALDAGFPIGLADDLIVAAFGGPAAVRAIPTAFLIDRTGHLAQAYPGFVPWEILRADIEAALEGLPLPSLATEDEEGADIDP